MTDKVLVGLMRKCDEQFMRGNKFSEKEMAEIKKQSMEKLSPEEQQLFAIFLIGEMMLLKARMS